MKSEIKPWGTYEVLYTDENCKIKKVSVKPSHRLSYHYHVHSKEGWVITRGRGTVILDEEEIPIKAGDQVMIQYHMPHRVSNTSENEDLIFIEVRTGTNLDDNEDIVRLSDDYDRVDSD